MNVEICAACCMCSSRLFWWQSLRSWRDVCFTLQRIQGTTLCSAFFLSVTRVAAGTKRKKRKKSSQESKGYPPKRPYPPRFLRQTAPHWVVTQPQLVRPTQFTSLHRIASAPQVSHELCSQAGFIPLVLLFAEKCSAVAIWCCHRHRVAPLSLDKLHGHVPPRKTARNWLSFD